MLDFYFIFLFLIFLSSHFLLALVAQDLPNLVSTSGSNFQRVYLHKTFFAKRIFIYLFILGKTSQTLQENLANSLMNNAWESVTCFVWLPRKHNSRKPSLSFDLCLPRRVSSSVMVLLKVESILMHLKGHEIYYDLSFHEPQAPSLDAYVILKNP